MSMGIMNGDSRPGPRSSRILMLLGGGLQAADAGADEDADFVPVDFVEIQPGILAAPAMPHERRIARSGPCAGSPWATETRESGSKFLTSAAIWVSNRDGVEARRSGQCRTGRRSGCSRRCRADGPAESPHPGR